MFCNDITYLVLDVPNVQAQNLLTRALVIIITSSWFCFSRVSVFICIKDILFIHTTWGKFYLQIGFCASLFNDLNTIVTFVCKTVGQSYHSNYTFKWNICYTKTISNFWNDYPVISHSFILLPNIVVPPSEIQ